MSRISDSKRTRRSRKRIVSDKRRTLFVLVAFVIAACAVTVIRRTDAAIEGSVRPIASPASSSGVNRANFLMPPETSVYEGSYASATACGPKHSIVVAAGKTSITVSAAATVETNDIVLNLYGPADDVLLSSDNATSPEAVDYRPSGGVPAGTYKVEVCPFVDALTPHTAPFSYNGTLTTDDTAVPGPSPTPTPAATPTPTPAPSAPAPRYHNYSPPQAIGENAAEPSIGFNPTTKRAMYIAGLQTLQVTFPENIDPEGSVPEAGPAIWKDVSYISTKTRTLDPILFTDQKTGRTFVSQLNTVTQTSPAYVGANSLMAFTDDDGASWTPAQLNLPDGSNDHQTVGSGPYPASVPLGNDVNKGSAVYYCGQMGNVLVATSVAMCSRSDNGGLTFGRAVPVYTGVVGVSGPSCSQLIHGHVKVAPDGTVYLPNAQCGGKQAVAVSTDAGMTWTVRPIPGSLAPGSVLDPSVGISNDPPVAGATSNTIYVGYTGKPSASSIDNHAYVAVSKDRGLTWSTPVDLGASHGINNAVFAQAVAGDSNRAAIAFLGTTTSGDHQSANFKGTWYGYVAHTYDGGLTWTTANATPNGPVQREACIWNGGGSNPCRNLLDFNDVTMDDRGRVMFAYADGCVDGCETGGPNSYSAKASIARQSGGKGLLALYDSVEPAVPQRPYLSGRRDDLASYLRWNAPDNGGTGITSYKIYRGTSPGNEVYIGHTTGDDTTFTDRSGNAAVANYTYKITAVNAQGEGQPSNIVALNVQPRVELTGACTQPGVTALLDPAGDSTNTLQQHDITSVSLAEPQDMSGKLVFTLKVMNLSSVPPGWRWAVRFGAPQKPPTITGLGAQEDWFVSMVTSDGAAPTFTYGSTGVPTVTAPSPVGSKTTSRVFSTIGPLDAASKANADGTITLVLPKSAIGNPAPGEFITGILGSVRATIPSALPGTGGTNETIPDSTGPGGYTLRAATLCLPNTAPLARLTADVNQGVKPLAVTLDGSTSTDADSIDAISRYTFNFGDGTDDVTQASPTLNHTFTQAGEYAVRMVVNDSRGKVSANTAQYLIKVARDPSCSTNVALAASGATATASSTADSRFPASGAIDGEHRGANWEQGGGWNDATRGVWPDSLEIDFGGSRKIDEIRVYTLQDSFTNPQEPTEWMTTSLYGLLNFDVQYWDGSQWITVPQGSVTGNDRVMRIFRFEEVTTTKIRVAVNSGRVHFSRIVELEAFGCSTQ